MADDLTRPFIGYRSAGRRPETQQDRRASADAPLAALRGMVSGVLGAPGDIESLVRMLPGLSEQTVLPTSEDVRGRLPGRSLESTPVGRAATELGTLGGGFYTGPGSPLRAMAALPSAVRRAGTDFAMAAGQPAVNVVKPKGGNWLAGTVERTIDPMRTLDPNMVNTLRNADPRLVDQAALSRMESEGGALDRWLETKLAKYIKNEMATPEDPIRALAERGIIHSEITPTGYNVSRARREGGFPEEGMGVSDLAKTWEARADTFVNPLRASDMTSGYYPEAVEANPWLLKVPPQTPVYEMLSGSEGNIGLGFGHLVDELRNAINPASGLPENLRWKYSDLDKVTVPQAVERVAKINEWRAAHKAEADLARSMNPATQVVKEYPDQGFKWVELRQPKETGRKVSVEKPEMDLPPDFNEQMGREVAEDMAFDEGLEEGTREFNEFVQRTMADFNRKKKVDMDESYKALEDALKYEGETMGHCVGGYCPDVVEGRSRIYSLRDKKGQPHVTIEVQPGKDKTGLITADELPPEELADMKRRNVYDPNFMYRFDDQMGRYLPELGPFEPSIVQIKGKANKAPKEEYLPAVQDFIRSGNWREVGDLKNAGLIDIQNPGQLAYNLEQIYGKDLGVGIDKFNAAVEATPEGQRYMTMQEFRKFLGEEPPEGFQAGGAVKAAKATAKNIGDLVEKYTPEFKQWFAGSKAATPEGEPLTVYRGATKDEGDVIKNGWFTKDPKVASMFSMKREKVEQFPNSVVTPAHLKMKNPLVVDAKGAYWDKIPFGDPRDKMFMTSDQIARFARDEKYDGVIFKNINETDDFFDVDPTDVFVTFNPNQAKSVFNKKPTSDPRLGFADGGLVDSAAGDANSPTGDFDPARIDSIVDQLHAMNAG